MLALVRGIRGMGHKCIAATSSGIAATLLKGRGGRRTAQYSNSNFFGIPIPVLTTSTCNVNLNTKLGKLLNESKLIIWDEALMRQRLAVRRMLKDITNNNKFFVEKY